MAEAEPWLSRIPCRYYNHGICRAGDSCHYAHDQALRRSSSPGPEGVPSPRPQTCRFFLRGCCTYGAKCRFEHTNAESPGNSSGEMTKNAKGHHGNRPVNLPKNCSGSPNSKMVVLKKGSKSADSNDSGIDMDGGSSTCISSPPAAKPKKPEDWVKAAEFVPGQPYRSQGIGTYSEVASCGVFPEEEIIRGGFPVPAEPVTEQSKKLLCPFAANGECRYGDNCTYTHGDICDLCFHPCLHPTDDEQRKKHHEECMAEIEKDMEESFAFQRSKEMSCGICMEVIMEKEPHNERRFGILSHCNHCFCLSCIRKWRQAKQFENKVVRACPECRKTSDFVTPSEYWVETKEEKEKLIEGYKKALGQKACKYFDQGRGECPFNERCFYKHALPDGTIVEAKPRPKRRRQNADGESDVMQSMLLWDFMDERDMLYDLFVNDLLEELMFPSWEDPDFLDTDSDDSDDYFNSFASFHL